MTKNFFLHFLDVSRKSLGLTEFELAQFQFNDDDEQEGEEGDGKSVVSGTFDDLSQLYDHTTNFGDVVTPTALSEESNVFKGEVP